MRHQNHQNQVKTLNEQMNGRRPNADVKEKCRFQCLQLAYIKSDTDYVHSKTKKELEMEAK